MKKNALIISLAIVAAIAAGQYFFISAIEQACVYPQCGIQAVVRTYSIPE